MQWIDTTIANEDAAAAVDWLSVAFGPSARKGQCYAHPLAAGGTAIRPPEAAAGMRLSTVEDTDGNRSMLGERVPEHCS